VYSVEILPKVTYPDIDNYLVFDPSPFTMDYERVYNGLEAVCIWLGERSRSNTGSWAWGSPRGWQHTISLYEISKSCDFNCDFVISTVIS